MNLDFDTLISVRVKHALFIA